MVVAFVKFINPSDLNVDTEILLSYSAGFWNYLYKTIIEQVCMHFWWVCVCASQCACDFRSSNILKKGRKKNGVWFARRIHFTASVNVFRSHIIWRTKTVWFCASFKQDQFPIRIISRSFIIPFLFSFFFLNKNPFEIACNQVWIVRNFLSNYVLVTQFFFKSSFICIQMTICLVDWLIGQLCCYAQHINVVIIIMGPSLNLTAIYFFFHSSFFLLILLWKCLCVVIHECVWCIYLSNRKGVRLLFYLV